MSVSSVMSAASAVAGKSLFFTLFYAKMSPNDVTTTQRIP